MSEQFNAQLPPHVAERVTQWKEAHGETKSGAAKHLIIAGLDAVEGTDENGKPLDSLIHILLIASLLSMPFGAVGFYAQASGEWAAWAVFFPFAVVSPIWGVVAIGLMAYRYKGVK